MDYVLKAFLRIIVAKETNDSTISLIKDILFIYPKLAFQFESEIYWKDDRLSLIEGFIDAKTPLSIESWKNFFKELTGDFLISDVKKTIKSTHKCYNIGLHTLNEYKGVAVIDVHGYRYGVVGKIIAYLVKFKKYLKH
jgi:hypothetical protein